MREFIYADAALDDSGAVSGTAVMYGKRSNPRRGAGGVYYDRFEKGCFGDVAALDVTLNRGHDAAATFARTGAGGLELRDTPEALTVHARPADTALWRDTRALMVNGTLRNLSIEVTIPAESCRFDYATRTRSISSARLTGIGIVERGGNVGTDAVLHRFNNPEIQEYVDIVATASGVIPYGKTLQCECLKSLGCRQVRFEPGSLADIGENVIAVGGGYDAPVASVAQGGLRFRHTDKGLEWEADIPQDANGEKILSAAEIAPVVGRPYIDVEASETTQSGETLIYTAAAMRSLIIRATDAVEGWDPALIEQHQKNRLNVWDLEMH
ncbi:hypothetical protein F4009_14410 [Candidatus Poribacteria bacterium]|nr:hypothetical protein [Candidatus Poribacteria bacterium]MYH19498.1 hypothetical protein [Gemmatimonadota bacterium]MYK95167.1 hypothetical protein [Candidatus Poribacteria bacterium]